MLKFENQLMMDENGQANPLETLEYVGLNKKEGGYFLLYSDYSKTTYDAENHHLIVRRESKVRIFDKMEVDFDYEMSHEFSMTGGNEPGILWFTNLMKNEYIIQELKKHYQKLNEFETIEIFDYARNMDDMIIVFGDSKDCFKYIIIAISKFYIFCLYHYYTRREYIEVVW